MGESGLPSGVNFGEWGSSGSCEISSHVAYAPLPLKNTPRPTPLEASHAENTVSTSRRSTKRVYASASYTRVQPLSSARTLGARNTMVCPRSCARCRVL